MQILYFFESIRNPVLTALFRFFSLFGEEMLVIGLVGFLLWCVDKKLAYRIGLVFFFSGLLSQALKISFRVDRPWVLDPDFLPVESAMGTATGYSFPSGHTQAATALYTSLGLELWARKKRWPMIVAAVLMLGVATARMYLGVHTFADVSTALILTLIVCFLAYYSYRRTLYGDVTDKPEAQPKSDLILSLGIAALSLAVGIYSFILIGSGTVPTELGIDCCKSAGAGLGFAIGLYLERRYVKFETKTPKWWMQIVKVAVGAGGFFALKELLKLLLGTQPVGQYIRYCLVVLWAFVLFPLLFKLVLKRIERKDNKQ